MSWSRNCTVVNKTMTNVNIVGIVPKNIEQKSVVVIDNFFVLFFVTDNFSDFFRYACKKFSF